MNISPHQPLEWNGRRYEKHQRGLPYQEVKDAMLNLLKDNIIVDEEAEQDPRTYHRRQEQEETATIEEDNDLISLPLFTKPLEPNSRMELTGFRTQDKS